MTEPSFIKATCFAVDCDYSTAFTVRLPSADTKRMTPRILAAVGWLEIQERWLCPVCAVDKQSAIGALDIGAARALHQAIVEAIQMRRIVVGGA